MEGKRCGSKSHSGGATAHGRTGYEKVSHSMLVMAGMVKMPSNGKMEIQNIVEKILAKHNIDATKDFYLKLTMSPYLNLVLERNGDIILVGHYREENGDLISDPVLAMEGTEIWCPVRIELWCGDTICTFYKDDKHMIIPDSMKEFRAFQRMFARNIKEQTWLENGGWLTMFRKQKVLAPKKETCAFCGQEYYVNKRDNSRYIDNKPICAQVGDKLCL